MKSGVGKVSTKQIQAYLDEYQKITVLIPKSKSGDEVLSFTLVDHQTSNKYELKIKTVLDLGDQIKYTLATQGFIKIGNDYTVVDEFQRKIPLQLGYIMRTEAFDKDFYYGEDDLGVSFLEGSTCFKIWSPTATRVRLLLENKSYEMKRAFRGVWELVLEEQLEGCWYRYEISHQEVSKEVIDPYGVASTANGTFSVVVNLEHTIPILPELRPSLAQETDAIIYELSIRDFTIHPSSKVKYRGKYLGLTEQVIDEEGNPYGLAYLKELGITHIQLMPFFDFEGIDELDPESSYNWGYNPGQYNVPEGSYATDSRDPYARINELKLLINTLHQQGFGVIMDVVYNHVYDRETFPFDGMVPTYFYRYDFQGMPANGSGCGNDLATERSMVRKFIVDSVKFWLKEYGVDGFRFDLMGLMDVDTINAIRRVGDEVSGSILLYGEGWDMDTPLLKEQKAARFNAQMLPRIGHFNDEFRDQIKGGTFELHHRGLALGDFSSIEVKQQLLAGSSGRLPGESFLFFSPSQSVNYVECHDNHTLWDRIKISNDEEEEDIRQRRQLLATAMVIFAQGIPFLHCGQEFFRSKSGVENSYQSPDEINAVNWNDVFSYREAIELVKGYIQIRKSHGAFRFATAIQVKNHLHLLQHQDSVIEYTLKDVKEYGPYGEIRLFFNIKNQAISLPILEAGFYVLADGFRSGMTPLKEVEGEIVLEPLSTTLIVKD